jgi:hypothetical protein
MFEPIIFAYHVQLFSFQSQSSAKISTIIIPNLNTIQDKFEISSTTSSLTNKVILFQTDSNLIAVGKNNNNKHRYIFLSVRA